MRAIYPFGNDIEKEDADKWWWEQDPGVSYLKSELQHGECEWRMRMENERGR